MKPHTLFFSMVVACGQNQPAHHAHADHPHGDHFHMRFEHAEEWAKVFDDPARDAWQKPDQVIDALRLDANARVADIGAGTGYFSARIAKRIPNGVVYAIDVEPDMVHFLCDRAKREGLENLKPVLSAADDPKAPEVDIVLVVDTYHHIPSREAYFQKIKAKKIAIVDFTKESAMGPPAEHRIPPEQVDRELGASGWKRTQTHTFLPNQYFLVFEK